jgi:hypothetical protein
MSSPLAVPLARMLHECVRIWRRGRASGRPMVVKSVALATVERVSAELACENKPELEQGANRHRKRGPWRVVESLRLWCKQAKGAPSLCNMRAIHVAVHHERDAAEHLLFEHTTYVRIRGPKTRRKLFINRLENSNPSVHNV